MHIYSATADQVRQVIDLLDSFDARGPVLLEVSIDDPTGTLMADLDPTLSGH